MYTDGGPDYRENRMSVQLTLIMFFLEHNVHPESGTAVGRGAARDVL